MIQPLFINTFQKGSSENANIGLGTFVGIDTYTKKGTARLSKKSVKKSGSVVTDLPLYFAVLNQTTIFAQGDTGKVYKSTDSGDTWTDITNTNGYSSGAGRGLIIFQGYVFAFRGTQIEYLSSPYGVANWAGSAWQTGLTQDEHVPFLFPNDNFVYFGNGSKVGKFGFGTATSFNPAGVSGTDYYYSASQLNGLPYGYIVKCISFLPTNYLALGTYSQNDSQVSDLILWNPTLSTYETPLRLYSGGAGVNANGINQLINRNNVLYAVTGGNMALFETNGTSFRLVEDFSLRTMWRKVAGAESQYPVFLDPKPSAIAVLGNKLLTGTATSIGAFPTYGVYPMGVWSVAFSDDGNSTQLELPISTGTITATTLPFTIGAIQPIIQGQVLIGWKDDTSYGIDKTDLDVYQSDINSVAIESPMFEIGTPLQPAVVRNIEIYLVNTLLSDQTISVYGRTLFSNDYTLIDTFTGDGTKNSYKSTKNSLGQCQYVQLLIRMSTAGSNTKFTPLLRNVQIS